MKANAYRALYLCLLIFLCGCNSDVFIKDFLPEEQMDIALSETDNTKEINFKADNWRLWEIMSYTSIYLPSQAYTLDGKPASLPFDEKETGVVDYVSEYINFRVEKRNSTNLKVILNENLFDENVEFYITAANDYVRKDIKLLLAPTSKYQIDSVVYNWNKFEIREGIVEEKRSLVVNNKESDSPVTFTFYPFRESTRKILFYNPAEYWDEVKFRRLLGATLPEITIPDIVDSKPGLHNTKAPFGIMEQELETSLDKKLSVEVTIDAHDKRQIVIFNDIERYSVPYKVYMSNPKTGKKRTFSGELTSSRPTDYFIIKKRVE